MRYTDRDEGAYLKVRLYNGEIFIDWYLGGDGYSDCCIGCEQSWFTSDQVTEHAIIMGFVIELFNTNNIKVKSYIGPEIFNGAIIFPNSSIAKEVINCSNAALIAYFYKGWPKWALTAVRNEWVPPEDWKPKNV